MSDAEADLRRIQADAEHLGDAGQRAFKHRDQLVRKYVLEKKLTRQQVRTICGISRQRVDQIMKGGAS